MKYLFELSHPKHYYQFKKVMHDLLKDHSNSILVIARDKDVLLDILKEDQVSYLVVGRHGKSLVSKIFVLPRLLINYIKIIHNNKIDVVVSKASPYAVICSKFMNIRTIITPDSEVVAITNKFVAPNSSLVITPENFSLNYGEKHKKIKGFFEDCYLHPSVFKPNLNEIKELDIDFTSAFFILRFISWNASHDINQYGFSIEEKTRLVSTLKKYGNVYISSEGRLPSELKKYRINIPPNKIHQVIHFASMYVGDSQTMATESALLGTPALRYNSFVGENDMTNFIILEEKYNLLRNFNDYSKLMECLNSFLLDPKIKDNWLKKRKLYYSEVGDVNMELKLMMV